MMSSFRTNVAVPNDSGVEAPVLVVRRFVVVGSSWEVVMFAVNIVKAFAFPAAMNMKKKTSRAVRTRSISTYQRLDDD